MPGLDMPQRSLDAASTPVLGEEMSAIKKSDLLALLGNGVCNGSGRIGVFWAMGKVFLLQYLDCFHSL